MGRGRKSSYINKLTSKDHGMLRAFANVGYLTPTALKEKLDIADRRVAGYERDGYIQKVIYLNKDSKNGEYAYRLTNKGKDLCSNKVGVESFYRSSSVNHDNALASYYNNISLKEKESWGTESQAREQFREFLEQIKVKDYYKYEEIGQRWEQGLISPPDGFYTTEQGTIMAIEVVTNSYGQVEIEAKQEFCSLMGMQYNQINA